MELEFNKPCGGGWDGKGPLLPLKPTFGPGGPQDPGTPLPVWPRKIGGDNG